ncbi:MAG TPA: hypothetical protein VN636_00950 [Acidimicrobiia bacterium]|nr:hypothetical protein [Acidimicrobiia bacterium]
MSPGQTSSTAVPLYTLSLHVQHANATPAPTTNVTAAETTTFGAPYTAVCTSGTGSGSTPTIGLVQTDANGNSVTAVPLVTGRSPRWARPSH